MDEELARIFKRALDCAHGRELTSDEYVKAFAWLETQSEVV